MQTFVCCRSRRNNSPVASSFLTASLLLTCLCLLPGAFAQTEDIAVGNHAGTDARTMGMGGASTGVAEDLSALYWNPAGLALVKQTQFSAGMVYSDKRVDAILLSGADSNDVHRTDARLNRIGAAFPLNSSDNRLVFAFGVDRVQDFDSQVDVFGQLGAEAPVLADLMVDERSRNSGGLYRWSAGLAGVVSRQVAIGATLDLWSGNSEEEILSDISDPDDVALIDFQRLDDIIDREYWGLGMRFGGLVGITDYARIGMQVELPMNLEVDEVWTQSTFERDDDGTEFEDYAQGAIVYDLRLPLSTSVGISLGDKRARIAADFKYTNWTNTEYSTPPETSIRNEDFEDFYQDVIQWRVGGEYLIEPLQTKIRAGYWSHPFAFTAKETVEERKFFTLGLGMLLDETLELNVAYVLGTWRRESDVLAEDVVTHQLFAGFKIRSW